MCPDESVTHVTGTYPVDCERFDKQKAMLRLVGGEPFSPGLNMSHLPRRPLSAITIGLALLALLLLWVVAPSRPRAMAANVEFADDSPSAIEAGTQTALTNRPVRSVSDDQPLRARVAAALATTELDAAERATIVEQAMAFLSSRFGQDGKSYAIGRLASGVEPRRLAEMLDENNAQIAYSRAGKTGSFADQDAITATLAIFKGLDEVGGGVNRCVGYVDGDDCVAVHVGTWSESAILSNDLNVFHWHGGVMQHGRRWFAGASDPALNATAVNVGTFLAFANGAKNPIHLRFVPSSAGEWRLATAFRHNTSSEYASLDY